MKTNRKAGFTLTELLIVVAVVGVLAAIAVPMFAGTLVKSRETVCLNNRLALQRHLIYDLMMNENMTDAQFNQAFSDYQTSDKDQCPSAGAKYSLHFTATGGKINIHTIGISCSVHAPGGLTNESAAGLDYSGWLSNYLEDPAHKPDQNSVLLAYKQYLAESGKSYLTVPKDEVLSLLPDQVTGFKGITDSSPLVWVPLRLKIGRGYEEIMLVTSKAQTQESDLRKGFVFSYQGEYYRSSNIKSDGICDYQGLYTASNQFSSFENFITECGWVKVEK